MKLQFFIDRGYGDCETCGSYSWERIRVIADDEREVLDHHGDDHTGGGLWTEPEDALREVLEALGHEVEFIEVDRGDPS